MKIFSYLDYRRYLEDFYLERKSLPSGYSYRQFSAKAGFTSPNFLLLVIRGKRDLSPRSAEKCLKALGLSAKEEQYFRLLVKHNQVKDPEARSDLLMEMKRITPVKCRRNLGSLDVTYLSHWIFPVIRELVSSKKFIDDPHWIFNKIRGNIGTRFISRAIKFLVDEKFIEKNNEGLYRNLDRQVVSSDEVSNVAISNFHRMMLEQGIEKLSLPIGEREFGALTFSISHKSMPELKSRLKEFRQDLLRWAHDDLEQDEHTIVVQVNLQMYPQTRSL